MTEQDVWNFLKEGEGKRRKLKALEAKKDKIEKDAYSIKASFAFQFKPIEPSILFSRRLNCDAAKGL